MRNTQSALRVFLKHESGIVTVDLSVFLGDSIALAMVVTGVAPRGSRIAANENAAPKGAAPEFPKAGGATRGMIPYGHWLFNDMRNHLQQVPLSAVKVPSLAPWTFI